MNCRPEDMLVYAVTDRAWLKGENLKDQVEKALKGGEMCIRDRYLVDHGIPEEHVYHMTRTIPSRLLGLED